MRTRLITVCTAVLCGTTLYETSLAAAKGKNIHKSPPDLTLGGTADDTRDWRLGPMGANGWVFNRSTRAGASRDARQILITRVDAGGPADGKLQVNDVILGIDGKTFSGDARKTLAAAIDEAESKENKGRLRLKVWRKGEEMEITLALKVLGRYSATSPYNCDKTDAIIDRACDYLKEKPLKDGWDGYITALGLLATGRDDLMPKLKAFAHEICVPGEVLNVETHVSMMCWKWSYKTLFLTEYYLLTKDEYVLPTITEYATKIAMGQSGVGTWGHTVCAKANTGHLHGFLGGYGAMNQTSQPLMMALVLAEKCGVTHDEITQALKRGEVFFEYYIGKGAIPYGDHKPAKEWFDDNGKCAAAAVMFDLLGNKRGAEFFSAMVLGSAPGAREEGHTGCFWSHLWGGMGAARSGEEGLSTFFREMRWSFDLERDWTGRLVFQGNAGEAGEKGTDKSKWDCTGPRLLQLCLPRKKLYITGKGMKVVNPLTGRKLAAALHAGRLMGDTEGLKALDRGEIVEMLGNELPPVRHYAAKAIVLQEIKMVDALIDMLDSDNVQARYGACDALGVAGYKSERAVAALTAKIRESDDLSLRLDAIDALIGCDMEKGLAAVAKPAIPQLLKLTVSRSKDDPRRLLQRKLGFALFYSGRALPFQGLIPLHGVDDIDRSQLIPAIKELLTVDDGRSRACVGWVYPKLTAADLELLWGDIYRATRDISPSGIMFADGVRISGLKLMQAQNVKEGVELAASILDEDRWGQGNRQNSILPILAQYGAAAKPALPAIMRIKVKDMTPVNKTVEAIEKGKNQPLKSIDRYIE